MKAILAFCALAFTFSVTSFAENKPPYNEKCPVCGKDAHLPFWTTKDGKRIIFATADCKDKFGKNPGKYKVTPKDK
jgi:YHS domain-containing protein